MTVANAVFVLTIATLLTAAVLFLLAPKERAVKFELAPNAEDLRGVERIKTQTYADFLFICAYTGLWGTLGATMHPVLVVITVGSAVADVFENLGILRAIARGARRTDVDARRIRVPSKIKWFLLSTLWIGLAVLPSSIIATPGSRLFIGLPYAIASVVCLVGLARSSPEFVGLALVPVGLALVAQVIVFRP